MKRLVTFLVGVSILCMFLSGCATVISKDVTSRANHDISADDVIESPETYKGNVVIWGGEIIAATNRKEGTVLQVLQKPVDVTLRPKKVDQSAGRFLAIYDGYLDVAIYEPGRQVTVAGHIQAIRVLPLGGIEYTYPVVGVEEIHLWEFRKETAEYPYRYYPHWYYSPPCWCW